MPAGTGPYFPKSFERPRLCAFVAPSIDESPFTATSGYTLIKGAQTGDYENNQAILDTILSGSTILGFQIENTHASGAGTVKVQASMDYANWTDIIGYDQTGTVHAATDVNVAAAGRSFIFVSPLTDDGGVQAGWRWYRLMGKYAASAATLRAYGYCK